MLDIVIFRKVFGRKLSDRFDSSNQNHFHVRGVNLSGYVSNTMSEIGRL